MSALFSLISSQAAVAVVAVAIIIVVVVMIVRNRSASQGVVDASSKRKSSSSASLMGSSVTANFANPSCSSFSLQLALTCSPSAVQGAQLDARSSSFVNRSNMHDDDDLA
jgi:hypothetical protein